MAEPYVYKDPKGFTRLMQVLVALVVVQMAGSLLLTLTAGAASAWSGQEEVLTPPQRARMTLDILSAIRIAPSILALFWFARMVENARTFGRLMEFRKRGVLWFFAPFLNLFMPFRMVKEVWEVSGGARAGLILFWWMAFLSENITGLIASRIDMTDPVAALPIMGISDAIGIVGGVLFIRLMGRLSELQRGTHLTAAFNEPPPANPLTALQSS